MEIDFTHDRGWVKNHGVTSLTTSPRRVFSELSNPIPANHARRAFDVLIEWVVNGSRYRSDGSGIQAATTTSTIGLGKHRTDAGLHPTSKPTAERLQWKTEPWMNCSIRHYLITEHAGQIEATQGVGVTITNVPMSLRWITQRKRVMDNTHASHQSRTCVDLLLVRRF